MAGDIYPGTFDLLILQSLPEGPEQGSGTFQWIRDRSSGVLDVGEATYFPTLHRLDRKNLIRVEWGVADQDLCALIPSPTKEGQTESTKETSLGMSMKKLSTLSFSPSRAGL